MDDSSDSNLSLVQDTEDNHPEDDSAWLCHRVARMLGSANSERNPLDAGADVCAAGPLRCPEHAPPRGQVPSLAAKDSGMWVGGSQMLCVDDPDLFSTK